MRHRPLSARNAFSVLGFALALAGPAGADFRPGAVSMHLNPSLESYLGISGASLVAEYCNLPPGPPVRDPRLVIANDGGGSTRAETVGLYLVSEVRQGSQSLIKLQPTALLLRSVQSFVGTCGTFDLSVQLDPAWTQPLSTVAVLSGANNSGLFAGKVVFEGRLVLELQGYGPVVERHQTLELDLLGRWTRPLPGANFALTLSDWLPFAETVGGAVVDRPGCAAELRTNGKLCLQLLPNVLVQANDLGP